MARTGKMEPQGLLAFLESPGRQDRLVCLLPSLVLMGRMARTVCRGHLGLLARQDRKDRPAQADNRCSAPPDMTGTPAKMVGPFPARKEIQVRRGPQEQQARLEQQASQSPALMA